MKNLGRSLTALAAVVSILGPGAQQSAFADNAVMRFTGSGTISPGLGTGAASQTVTFCGTGTVDAGSHAGTYNFCFNGTGFGTVASHSGCGTFSGDITGTACWDCHGNECQWSGNVTHGSTTGSITSGACVSPHTSINPVTTYISACVWVLNH